METRQDIAYLSDIKSEARVPAGATPGNLVAFGANNVLQDTGKTTGDFISGYEVSQMIDHKVDPEISALKSALTDQYAIAAYKSDAWEADKEYFAGDFCMYGGAGYRAKTTTDVTEFNPEEWEVVLTAEGKTALDTLISGFSPEGYAQLLNLAPAFGNKDYEVGNLVVKNGVIQICTVAGRGSGAIFTSDNATVDNAITQRIAPFKTHVSNTGIHVSSEDRTAWNGKQDVITDLADIRNNAKKGAEAADRDFVVIESDTAVKACDATVSNENEAQVEHNTSETEVQANGFKLNLKSYCTALLDKVLNNTTDRLPKQIKFSAIEIYSRGSTSKAKMVISRDGSVVAQSSVITLRGSSAIATNAFYFGDNVWLDAVGEYEFKILGEDGSSYISGLYILVGDADITVEGFATNYNGGSYTAVDGCFSGAVRFDIQFYATLIDLATRSSIPTKVSQLQNDENFVKEADLPPALTIDVTLTKRGEAADAKAVGDAIANADPSFSQGIKFGEPDTVNNTIEVLTFGNIDTLAEDDNSNLSGSISIPPYKDVDGNRYSVVGIQGTLAAPFYDNENLVSITTPATLNKIKAFAFYGCTYLFSASLPAVDELEEGAFANCSSLKTVSLPAVDRIGDEAFDSCTSLSVIDFGYVPHSSIPSLGDNVFPSTAPTGCKIIVPDSQYAAWTAATIPDPEHEGSTINNPWHDLIAQGYRFLRYSEWEVVRKYELSDAIASVLSGNTYNFTTNVGLYTAVRDMIIALGGTVTNFPTIGS